jgi:hypothetical protein
LRREAAVPVCERDVTALGRRVRLVLVRAQVLGRLARYRSRLVSVALVLAGLAGALGGGWLVGRWCLGLVLIFESAGALWFGLFRDDGEHVPVRGARTPQQVLDDERLRP